MNSVRTIKLFQLTELNLVNSNTVGARNTAANIDNNNKSKNKEKKIKIFKVFKNWNHLELKSE